MQRAVRCLDSRIQWHGLAGSEDPDALNALFRRVAPTLLFAPPPFDFHPDHRAALPRHATTMWYYEVHAPFGPFEPTVHVTPDKDSLQRKAAALGAHASQVHLFDAVGRLGRFATPWRLPGESRHGMRTSQSCGAGGIRRCSRPRRSPTRRLISPCLDRGSHVRRAGGASGRRPIARGHSRYLLP